MSLKNPKSKFRFKYLSFLVVIFAVSNCGMVEPYDLTTNTVISGSKASSIIAEETYTAQIVCAVRTGLPQEFTLETLIRNFHGIDTNRGYKISAVDNCKDILSIAIMLSSNCSYTTFKCNLNPVNVLSGAN